MELRSTDVGGRVQTSTRATIIGAVAFLVAFSTGCQPNEAPAAPHDASDSDASPEADPPDDLDIPAPKNEVIGADQRDGGDDDSETRACVPRCSSDGRSPNSGFCGSDGCGGYCKPCAVELSDTHPEQRWSLCDETSHTCAPPHADCNDGWCRIPARSFVVGDADEPSWSGAWPPQPVVLTRAFEIMATEVTRGDWFELMPPSRDPSPHAACGSTCPMNGITFFGALEFANEKSKSQGLPECYELMGCVVSPLHHTLDCEMARFAGPDCSGFRLPSEAEWELAAGAGANTCLPNGPVDKMQPGCWGYYQHDVGWYCGNSESNYEGCSDCSWREYGVSCCSPHPVGQKQPNRFGLYDTSGNVREYTTTIFEEAYARGLVVDPGFDELVTSDDAVAARGGWFAAASAFCCGWSRSPSGVGTDGANWKLGPHGFRLARTAASPD